MKQLFNLLIDFIYLLPRIIAYVIILLFFFIFISINFRYLETYLFPLHLLKGKAKFISKNVIIGPYPEKRDLKKLKEKQGVTVVISLLDPSIPFEKSLLEKEKEITEKLGLKLFNFPLGYFHLRSEKNQQVVEEIIQFIKSYPKEKFYIHCYLGKHRIELVRERLKNAETK